MNESVGDAVAGLGRNQVLTVFKGREGQGLMGP